MKSKFTIILTCLSVWSCSDDDKTDKDILTKDASKEFRPANQRFENALGMKFVAINGTNALFCIHETRNMDFLKFAEAKGVESGPWRHVQFEFSAQRFNIDEAEEKFHPVVNITVKEAIGFCEWLTKEDKDGKTYRLPTNEEWSLAAGLSKELGGKIQCPYIWGSDRKQPDTGNYWDIKAMSRIKIDANVFSNLLGDYNDNVALTASVMSFKPNSSGIFDMGGNVKEWCVEYEGGKVTSFVMRDASWAPYLAEDLEAIHEGRESADFRGDFCGFRVVAMSKNSSGEN